MYNTVNNKINQLVGVNKPINRNTMKTTNLTNGQMMLQNFPVGTKLTYQGSDATIIDHDINDASPMAIILVNHYERPFKAQVGYNKLVELAH